MSAQAARATVLAHSSDMAPGTAEEPSALFADDADTVCCDPQVENSKPEDRVMLAQLVDIVTGAAKLLFSATDHSKEQEEAARAAELQKQREENAQAAEKNRELKALEMDEQKRLRLADPFATSDESPAMDRPANDAKKGPSTGTLASRSAGSLSGPTQGSLSALPNNAVLIPQPPVVVTDLPAQVFVPSSQAVAPAGTIVISMEQEPPAANAVAPLTNNADAQETPARIPAVAPNAGQTSGTPKDIGHEKAGSGNPPAQVEKAPAPPAKKSDNPFDD